MMPGRGFPLPPPAAGAVPSGMLNGPPPNPMLPGPTQMPGALGGPSAPTARQLPPEVLQGLMQSGQSISEMLDSMASMVPDLAPELALAQQGLKSFLAKVLLAGGGPSTPGAAGTMMPNGIPPSPSPSS